MPEHEFHELPQRWRDLDKRTIEWIARLNEDERERLIDVSHMDEKATQRLRQFLALPDDKWDAGFRIVTRSVVIGGALRKFPALVVGLAAVLVAINQILGWIAPYLARLAK